MTKNTILPKFKMTAPAAAIFDFIKVPFLRRGWTDSYQILYAEAK